MLSKAKAIVLGGGLSGCMMAYLLKAKGYDVLVVEKDRWIGGLCKTFKRGDNKYEFGPHIFHAKEQDIIEFVRSLSEFQEVIPIVKACPFNDTNKLYDYPLTVENVVRLENWKDVIMELYNVNLNSLDSSNFETYVKSLIGPSLYELFVKNYNKKQWGINPTEMSAKWAPKRISFRKDCKTLFHNMCSLYPKGGFDSFFESLMTGVTLVQEEVEELIYSNNRVEAVRLKNRDMIVGDIFVSTIPIDHVLGFKGILEYRGVYKSFLKIKREHLLSGLWYTFPNHHSFTRIVEYKHYNFEENETSILSAAFPYSFGVHVGKKENEWDNEFRKVLIKLFGITSSDIIDQFGVHGELSYPLVTDENERKFDSLLDTFCHFQNLFSVGRLGLFVYVPMHICIKQCYKLIDFIDKYESLDKNKRKEKYYEIR